MNNEPQPAEHESGFRKNTVERLNRIVRTLGDIASKRSVSLEREHLAIQVSAKNGLSMHVHGGFENFSFLQDWETMGPDNYVQFTMKTLIGKKPSDPPYKDAHVRISREGIQIAKSSDGPEIEDQELQWEQPTKTQVLGLSVALARMNATTDSED
jgi:hypothetical protein